MEKYFVDTITLVRALVSKLALESPDVYKRGLLYVFHKLD